MKSKIMAGLALVLFMQVGCASADGASGNGEPIKEQKFMDERETVEGPDLSGEWESDCSKQRSAEKPYRVFSMTIEGEQVQRSERYYEDRECTELVEDQTHEGIFRFVEAYADGSYEVEYAFQLDNGIRFFTLEKVLLEDGKLYLSDMVSGDMAFVLKGEPLWPVRTDPQNSEL